ncbi:CapA family protein [Phormidium sp. CCY1219]|uniref:CapA family protein n=1 Tax=Phormidium sp. CCY1219 TaxID=2886104 RepID=UPI002D7995FA|nr:CapA family protein [Phormidium sp. CCY1219]
MEKQDILSLATQGDPIAIALLLNQVLQPKRNITAQVIRKKNRLHILLESDRIPDPEAYVPYIKNGLNRLQLSCIDSVRIYGRQTGETAPAWDRTLEWGKSPESNEFSISRSPRKQDSKAAAEPSPRDADAAAIAADTTTVAPTGPSATPVPTTLHSRATTTGIGNPPPEAAIAVSTLPSVGQSQIGASVAPSAPLPAPETPPEPIPPRKEKSAAIGNSLKILVPLVALTSFCLGISWEMFKNPDRYSPTVLFSTVGETLAAVELPDLPPLPSLSPSPATFEPFSSEKPIAHFTELSKRVEASIPATPITIKAVGDIVPGTNFPANKLPQREQSLFESVKPYLQGADILFGNFESTLTNHPYSAKDVSRSMVFAFRNPPAYAQLLKDVGFDVLNLANNHSNDFGEVGLEDTIENITKAGMKVVGKKDEILYLNVKNVPIAFIGFSTYYYHNSVHELEAAKALVEEAKQKATIVVISVHGGAEGTGALHVKNRTEMFYGENRGNLVLFSRAMIDAGADLILGHGPHVPRALEIYQGKLIAYSLGNFVGYRTLSNAGKLGYSLILEVEMDIEGNFVAGKIIPVHLKGKGIPYIDQQFRTVQLMRDLIKSDFPETPIAIDDEGKVLIEERGE